MRRNNETLPHRTFAMTKDSAANDVFSLQKLERILDGAFTVFFALVPLAMFDDAVNAAPYEAFAGVVSLSL